MKRGVSKWLQSIVGIVLGLALIYYLAGRVSLPEVKQQLSLFSLKSILASTFLVMLSVPLRALQWHKLLGGVAQVRWFKVFRAVCFGNAGNLVLPMRGGEVVKVASIKHGTELSMERVLLTLVLCRIQDLPFIGMIFLFFLSQVDLAGLESRLGIAPGSLLTWPHTIQGTTLVLPTLLVGLLVLAIGGIIGRKRLANVNDAPGPFITWLKKRISILMNAIRSAGDPRTLISSTLAAGLCWILFISASIPLLLDMQIPMDKTIYAALMVTGATTFFQLLPSAPTAAGTFHFGCTLGLSLALPDIEPSRSLAFAIVLHGIGALAPVTPCFFLFPVWARKIIMSKNEIRDAENQ